MYEVTVLQVCLTFPHLYTEEQTNTSHFTLQDVSWLSEVGSEPCSESLVSLHKPSDTPPPV